MVLVNTIWLLGIAIFLLIRWRYASLIYQETRWVVRSGPPETILAAFMWVPTLLLPLLHICTPLLSFADRPLPAWSQWAGLCVLVASRTLLWRTHTALGRNWSPTLEILARHELVTTGPFRRIRHPMYASLFLWGVAQVMVLENWLVGWSLLAIWTPCCLLRVFAEEEMMRSYFGASWRMYRKRTDMLIPRLF